VVATGTEDEDTDSGLVFKRQRVVDIEGPLHSATNGRAPSFRDNPPSASSSQDLIVLEGGGENASEGHQAPTAVELPAILQQALKCFQNQEVMNSLSEDPTQSRVAQGLGEYLIASSLSLSKVQDLQAGMAKLREELASLTKVSSTREAAFNKELMSLQQSEKEVKRLLFEKSQEALQSESKILPLRNKVSELEEKVEEMQTKMAKLEERVTQREVQLGQVEGELSEKVELFKQTKEELNNDVADAYGKGFQDAMAQFACVRPEVDLSPFAESEWVVDGQLMPRE